MQKTKFTGLGASSFLANVMAAGTVSNTLSASGSSSQANSALVLDDVNVYTTAASNSGARLPLGSAAGDVFFIGNQDANTMLIYPPTGGKLNNGSANASVSLPTVKPALCISIDGTSYIVNISA